MRLSMRNALVRSLGVFVLAGALCQATPAAASSVSYYAELLTSDAFQSFSDRRAQLTLDTAFDPLDVSLYSAFSTPGLGAAMVPPTKTYSHLFVPPAGVSASQIRSASLLITFVDDYDIGSESVEIRLDDDVAAWMGGAVNSRLVLRGDVTSRVSVSDAGIDVTASATKGDAKILYSVYTVKFDPGIATEPPAPAAVPEPQAVLVFALGAAVVAWFIVRRRRVAT